jgi:hypothetical protein
LRGKRLHSRNDAANPACEIDSGRAGHMNTEPPAKEVGSSVRVLLVILHLLDNGPHERDEKEMGDS